VVYELSIGTKIGDLEWHWRASFDEFLVTLSVTVILLLTDWTSEPEDWYRILPKNKWKSTADTDMDCIRIADTCADTREVSPILFVAILLPILTPLVLTFWPKLAYSATLFLCESWATCYLCSSVELYLTFQECIACVFCYRCFSFVLWCRQRWHSRSCSRSVCLHCYWFDYRIRVIWLVGLQSLLNNYLSHSYSI